jgi:hypothetical protein
MIITRVSAALARKAGQFIIFPMNQLLRHPEAYIRRSGF